MSTAAWGGLALVVILVLYVLSMRLFFREGRALEKQIDYSKIRPPQDEDDAE